MSKDNRRPNAHVAGFAWLAFVVLWIEAIVAAFWPVPTLIGGFLILAFLGIPPALPAIVHILLLAIFAALLIRFSWAGWRRLVPPVRSSALRRVERDSGLAHRPFETLNDRLPENADPMEFSLWRLHQDRRRNDLHHLRVSPPNPNLPERDPRALRIFVLITVILGLVIAGPGAGRRIVASLIPSFTASTDPIPLEAWIKPPAYTGLGPILLKADMAKPVQTPIGSTLEAHVTGGTRLPHFVLGAQRKDFKELEGGGFALSETLTIPEELSIRRGWSTLGQWNIKIIPDEHPVVAFMDPPREMGSGALRIAYQATDDYGVAAVEMRIRLADARPDIIAEPIAVTLTSGQTEKDLAGTSYQDLTAHPWAGMTVSAKLIATDTGGQSGDSDEAQFTLPERKFTNQTAQAIAVARKHIILNDAPHYLIAMQLSILATQPQLYGDDSSVFLALRAASGELRKTGKDPQIIADVEDLLWNAALKIDGGDRPEAEKELRAAEDALEKALKDPKTPPEEISRLVQNLKEAMNRDMDAMAELMRQRIARGEQPEPSPPDADTQTINRSDLENQIEKMDQLSKNGARQSAQEMLAYLKSVMENIRPGVESGAASEQGKKALNALKDLTKKQRELEKGGTPPSGQKPPEQNAPDQKPAVAEKNKAPEAGQKPPPNEKNATPEAAQKPQSPEKNGEPTAAQNQEALRKSLGDTARDIGDALGNIPKSVSEADKSMRDAEKALDKGQKGEAQADQEKAAEQLDQAVESLADQMSQQGETQVRGDGDSSSDPLGRGNSAPDRKGFKVPTERDMQRSRAILDELRRRSSERNRTRPELDYLMRLLEY